MARMIVADHDYVTKRYKLHKLKELEELVADAVQVCHLDQPWSPKASNS